MKSVASKTGDDAGDGTTTATILTQAIVTEGLKKCGCWCKSNGFEARY